MIVAIVILGVVLFVLICLLRGRNSQIEQQGSEIYKQLKKINEQEEQIEQLTASLELLQNQLKFTEDALRDSKETNLQLVGQLDRLNYAKELLTNSLKTARGQIKATEDALHVSQRANEALSAQSQQLRSTISEQDSLIGQLKKDVAFYADITSASVDLNDTEESLELTPDDLDEEQRAAFDLMMTTNENLFITGKAGTGKSALLKVFADETVKCILKLAPTGISAINVHGTTIHSAFGYDNLVKLSYDQISENTIKLNTDKRLVLKNASAIIIDEISMVRSDEFEKIDRILKIINQNDLPFGGKQIILFGDLFQLPPIAGREERKYLDDVFGGIHFFHAPAYEHGDFRFIELTVNHRQSTDQRFFDILNGIREGTVTDSELDLINSRTEFDPSDLHAVTRLFAKKADAEAFNRICLSQSSAAEFVSTARILYPENGLYPNKGNNQWDTKFPITERLKVKKGSLVMFVKNNGDKWVNGTLGIVKDFFDNRLRISVNDEDHDVFPAEFEELEAKYTKGKISYQVVCRVSQYPVVLAYAMTIHKAQGQTYGKIACDVSDCFATGQAYVALSRVKHLDGLFLMNKVSRAQIQVDSDINRFYVKNKFLSKIQDEKTANKFRRAYNASFEIVKKSGDSYLIRSGKNEYTTSATRCNCGSFKYNPNRATSPCKHMIWLAFRTGVLPPYYRNT